MCGDEIHIAANASMFIHNPWGCCCGEADDFEKSAKVLNTIKQQIVNTHAARTGASENDIIKMMSDGTYLTAQDAKDKGFVDSIEDMKLRAAAFADDAMFKAMLESAPENVRAALEAVAKGEEEAEEGAESGEPGSSGEASAKAVAGEEKEEETPAEETAGEEGAGSGEQGLSAEASAMAEAGEEAEEKPSDPRAELKKYIAAFGAEKGANWFAEGKSYIEAMAQHNKDLLAENAKLTEQINQARSAESDDPPVNHNATHTDETAARAAEKKRMENQGVGGGVAALAASLKTKK
jgi:hypothetical protein